MRFLFFKVSEAYGELKAPEDGVIIHGVFVDAGRWCEKSMQLVDAKPGKNVFKSIEINAQINKYKC